MSEVSEEVKDIKNTVAFNILEDLEREGKLNPNK